MRQRSGKGSKHKALMKRAKRRATLVLGLGLVLALTTASGAAFAGTGPSGSGGVELGRTNPGSTEPALYCVGAAKVDITPTPTMIASGSLYLGGYGIGPVHPAHGVLRQIYSRSIAIGVPQKGACPPGSPPGGHRGTNQVVITADDLQGHFLAYQQGPYGFAGMENHIQSTLGIPASHDLIQSVHTHNGPDDLGIWGGVPDSYLAEVMNGTEVAITQAVGAEQLATVKWATADMTGFGNGDTTAGPIDNTLRMLQATSTSTGAVIATMLNYSQHATVYGPLDEVSPDWPGATATYLEGSQIGDPGTGYPGSVAVVTVGAMGETHPAGVPNGDAAVNGPSRATDNNYPADHYGDAVGAMGMTALANPAQTHLVSGRPQVNGASSSLTVVNDNPVLLGAVLLPLPGYHTYRAYLPPYGLGDVLTTEAQLLRVGNLAFMAAPGEPYPAIEFTLTKEIGAQVVFPLGLANDQLGYIMPLNDYPSALQCSTTDEGFFTISPFFGNDFEASERSLSHQLGFSVTDPGPVADANLGTVPPSTSCTAQKLSQAAQNSTSTLP